jgi:threonine synthase
MGVIARFRARLPLAPEAPALSLGEGSTPLIPAPRLSERLGIELWLKLEGSNPTGSFKDRGMAVAVAQALADGARGIVCASTGNTAASAAAYAARAGIPAVVLHPAGAVATAKGAQARAAGARVVEVDGSFDDALRACLEDDAYADYTVVNSLNADRLEGQKTAAFEVLEELGRTPDVVALPYGGGGNLRAYAKGFAEAGVAPRLLAAQAADRARTVASAIRIARPAHGEHVAALVAEGRAEVATVDDATIVAAWRDLARSEGAFCEPASAAGFAALERAGPEPGSLAVCVLTGHGLKDPEVAAATTATAALAAVAR